MWNALQRLLFGHGGRLIPVSVQIDPLVYARLERLARHTEHAGDAFVNTALRDWLDEHESALLRGDEFIAARE